MHRETTTRRLITWSRAIRAKQEGCHHGPAVSTGARLQDRNVGRAAGKAVGRCRWVLPAEPDAFVFAGPYGGALRVSLFRSRFWRPATVAAGLNGLRIHDLRHTAVALWIAAGANPKEVAARAGHASVSFTGSSS